MWVKSFLNLMTNNYDKGFLNTLKLELDKIKNDKKFEQFYKDNKEDIIMLEEIIKEIEKGSD